MSSSVIFVLVSVLFSSLAVCVRCFIFVYACGLARLLFSGSRVGGCCRCFTSLLFVGNVLFAFVFVCLSRGQLKARNARVVARFNFTGGDWFLHEAGWLRPTACVIDCGATAVGLVNVGHNCSSCQLLSVSVTACEISEHSHRRTLDHCVAAF